jgi:hypothetical protein
MNGWWAVAPLGLAVVAACGTLETSPIPEPIEMSGTWVLTVGIVSGRHMPTDLDHPERAWS